MCVSKCAVSGTRIECVVLTNKIVFIVFTYVRATLLSSKTDTCTVIWRRALYTFETCLSRKIYQARGKSRRMLSKCIFCITLAVFDMIKFTSHHYSATVRK